MRYLTAILSALLITAATPAAAQTTVLLRDGAHQVHPITDLALDLLASATPAAAAEALDLPPATYPVFVLTVPHGASWTDFELKASRTNFGEAQGDGWIYYYHSAGELGHEVGAPPDVWYNDTGIPARNRWIAQQTAGPRIAIADALADGDSQVGGIIIIVTDPAVIDASRDTGLVWSYSWMDGSSADTDTAGRSIWRPIVPTAWIEAVIEP